MMKRNSRPRVSMTRSSTPMAAATGWVRRLGTVKSLKIKKKKKKKKKTRPPGGHPGPGGIGFQAYGSGGLGGGARDFIPFFKWVIQPHKNKKETRGFPGGKIGPPP
eukprot:FR740716.1.p2 GENE.FR740716.1~~FR740716.1.p2  ORF type:complete len:106 (+),score=44.67 FR740716.1:679-996(+)